MLRIAITVENVERLIANRLDDAMAEIAEAMREFYGDQPPQLVEERIEDTRQDILEDLVQALHLMNGLGLEGVTFEDAVDAVWVAKEAYWEQAESQYEELVNWSDGAMRFLRKKRTDIT
jgi:hypothetical protein